MPGRKFVSGEGCHFGFNGVEQEDEIAEGVNFTYFRMQDSRLGRWWSHDPKPNVSVSPYAMMENNPVMFSDVLGDTVRNADKMRREKYEKENNISGVDAFLSSLRNRFGDIDSKKGFKGTKAEWKSVKKAKKRIEKAKSKLEELVAKEKATQNLIDNWKIDDPELFKKVNEAKNDAGEPVDMLLGVKDLFSRKNGGGNGGFNRLPIYKTGSDGIIRPYSSEFGVNSIVVYIYSDIEDVRYFGEKIGQNVLNHEAGHFYILATEAKAYKEYLDKLKIQNRKYNGGHNSDDISGQKAIQWGKGIY